MKKPSCVAAPPAPRRSGGVFTRGARCDVPSIGDTPTPLPVREGSPKAPSFAHRCSPRYRGARGAFLLAALLILVAAPIQAAIPHRRAVLVLLHGTTAETFLRAISDPKWERLRSESALGLMNATVPEPMTVESAYLTLGAGRRLKCPPGVLPTPGQDRLEAQRQQRRDTLTRETPEAGALVGAAIDSRVKVMPVCQADQDGPLVSPGLLAAVGSHGELVPVAPLLHADDPSVLNNLAQAKTIPDGLYIIDLPRLSTDGTLRVTYALTRALDPVRDLLILTSADPGPPSHGEWASLAPVLIWNWGWHGKAVTANTTRTRGLIANIDIAPTLLTHLGVPIPATMLGHPAHPAGSGSVESALRYARGLRAIHEAMKPGLIAWGAFAFLGFLAGVAALLTRSTGMLRQMGRFWLTWAAAFIPAMLLAGVTFCGTATELVARVAVISLVLAAVAWSARRRISPVLSLYGLIVLTVLADLFTGSHLLQRSLLGDYAFTGARFYGIGNEFEGLILGTSILAPIWWVQERRGSGFRVQGSDPPRPPEDRVSADTEATAEHDPTPYPSPGRRGEVRRSVPGTSAVDGVPAGSPRYRGAGEATSLLGIAALWLLTLYAVSAPARGADFGGAFSLAVGYAAAAVGFWQLRTGKRLRFHQLLLAGGVVAVVVAAMIGADLLRPAGSRSHVGDLAARALSEGWRPVWEIAVRKVAMNVSFILSPYCLVSLAGVLPVVAFGYHKLDPASRSILARRPLLRVGLIAALIGAVAGLLANDSGIVAWAFATGCALLLCLDLMLDDGARKAPAASGTAPLPASEIA